MRVSLPRLRCLEPSKSDFSIIDKSNRHHTFVFSPPRYGPQQIGIQFPRYTQFGYQLTKALRDVSADWMKAEGR